ncbi:MAG TPA: hypothetical protein VFS09_05590 [Candidatus Eisenbacteria bacterium]|nr:hypothetical protein [Candidatus Eisenbacteria bacterium]
MRIAALFVAPLLLTASVALADDAPSAEPDRAPSAAVKGTPTAPALEPRDPAASPETGKATADLKRIRERAGQVDPKEMEATEKSLRETAEEVDASMAKKEKVEAAGRLAAEFGGIPELYIGEHERLKRGWGEIAIAHMLLANAKTTLTIDQIFDLRQEKMGWGQIAHGLDLNAGEFAKSAQAQMRSAAGPAGAAGKSETVEAKADPAPKGEANAAGKPAAKPAPAAAKSSSSEAPHGNSNKSKK